MNSPTQPKPDVCLLLEGTYPYVSGGVSTWVHQIINALPEIRFSLFFIGSEKQTGVNYKYKLPPNIVSIEEVYLHEPAYGRVQGEAAAEHVTTVVTELRRIVKDRLPSDEEANAFLAVSRALQTLTRQCSFEAFWKQHAIWELVTELYEQLAPHESFLDFYYAVQALAEPIWKLVGACDRIPPARMYHSLCTGYAGFAAGLVSSAYQSSFLLSEHGIYVRERIAELQKARWIMDPPVIRPSAFRNPGIMRMLWIQFFKLLARFAYQTANYVTSLFENNARSQIEFGADPRRIEIIPNGIHIPDFYQLRGKRRANRQTNPNRMNVGFIGRVVQIKDVKTLLKSARLVVNQLPAAKFLIAGPLDEEPAYVEECQTLCHHLGLDKNVEFLGPQRVADILPEMDLMLLTSVSEGLPFVILESFAAGIPIVSTDVGACRELIEGRASEKPAHGVGGFVVPVGDAEMIAAAMVRILSDSAMADRMGDNGRLRVENYYASAQVVRRYRELYQLTPKDFTRTGLVPLAHLKTSRVSTSTQAVPTVKTASR